MPIASGVSIPAYWSKRMQAKQYRTAVFREIANFEEQALLKDGDTVHRPSRSNLIVNTMGTDGSYTRQTISDTDETLVVDRRRETSFYVPDPDAIQSHYPTINLFADDAGRALANGIDGDVLERISAATLSVDDADLGGTAGNGIVVTETNVFDLFLLANEKLDRNNSDIQGRVAVCSPQLLRVLKTALTRRESVWGDQVGERGFMGMFSGFNIYKSNGLYHTAVLALATQPTDGDTVTINLPDSEGARTTITFTFRTVLGVTANNVLIGASADAARLNLTTLINAPGTTTAEGVALSAANQALLSGVAAVNDATANTLTLNSTGKSYVVVGETLTAGADVWTPATQLQHNWFGRRGAVDVVIQAQPKVEMFHRDGFVGKDIVAWQFYGRRAFTEGARQMVDVRVRADQFLAS